MLHFGRNGLQKLFFTDASFLLTLHWLESMASSRSRLRLRFTVRGRGEEFDWDEEEDEGFVGLLEQSLTVPLHASLRARLALHILNNTLRKKKQKQIVDLEELSQKLTPH